MKHYLACAAFAAATLVLGACGAQEKETTTETTQTEETVGLKIAYVELDTLMSQYQLYKDYSEVLTRKGNNIQKTLAQKQRALENHAASIQKKYESNEFTTRDELERASLHSKRTSRPGRSCRPSAKRIRNGTSTHQRRSTRQHTIIP